MGGGGSATSDRSRSSLRRTVASRRAASAGVMMDIRESRVPGEDASAEKRRGKPVGADSRATGVRERGVASNGDRTPETPRRA